MGRRLRLASTGSFSPLPPCNTPAVSAMLSLLLFFTILHSGQAYVVRWNNSAIIHPKTLPHLLGSVEGYSLALAKDGSRISTTEAPPIVGEEHYSGHQAEGGRGGHGIQHHGHGHVVDMQQPLKHHHQQPPEEESPKPLPDFEKQLSQLKEDPGSVVESKPQQSILEDDVPIKPVSRKDDLFTPGLGVEEVSLFPPPRRGAKKEGEEDDKQEEDLGDARPLDLPVKTDLLASEADVLEELKKLSAIHDAMDPSHLEPPTRPPFKVEESTGAGIGGAVEDHYSKSDEDDDSDEDGDDSDEEDDESNDEEEDEEEEEEEATEDPAREVASLEERLSKSLRKLADRRKQDQKGYGAEGKLPSSALDEYNAGYSPSGFYMQGSGPGTAPETASAPGTALGASGDSAPGAYPGVPRTYPIGGEITSSAPEMPSLHEEKGDETSRAVMKKAHMARKLMDPEDPKKDEDLLELMLRIAENPDEWKRVHHLLRQLDDDLTTYEKTMHRVEALAMEKSSGETKKGRKKKPGEEDQEDKELRRIEMSKSGLPSGMHGENLSSTTQQPLQTTSTSASTHHKDWPRFAYHRVTTAPHPYFLQQQNHQDSPPHHRNAYIAVSVITPPKGRHGGTSKPLSPPPPVNAVSPTPEAPYRRLYVSPAPESVPPQPRVVVDVGGREISEETLREPMEEEEIVENVAKAASRGRHHKAHGDPIEEQLRTLAGVEAKLRHRLHEKERMRHVLQEAARGEQYEDYNRSKRSVKKSASKRQNRPNGLILLKTS